MTAKKKGHTRPTICVQCEKVTKKSDDRLVEMSRKDSGYGTVTRLYGYLCASCAKARAEGHTFHRHLKVASG